MSSAVDKQSVLNAFSAFYNKIKAKFNNIVKIQSSKPEQSDNLIWIDDNTTESVSLYTTDQVDDITDNVMTYIDQSIDNVEIDFDSIVSVQNSEPQNVYNKIWINNDDSDYVDLYTKQQIDNKLIQYDQSINKIGTKQLTTSSKDLSGAVNELLTTINAHFIDIGTVASLAEIQTKILSAIASFPNHFAAAIKINVTVTTAAPYAGGIHIGHIYKTSNQYFCGTVQRYGAGTIEFSYLNGTWSHYELSKKNDIKTTCAAKGSVTFNMADDPFYGFIFSQGTLDGAFSSFVISGYGSGTSVRYHFQTLQTGNDITLSINNKSYVVTNNTAQDAFVSIVLFSGKIVSVT